MATKITCDPCDKYGKPGLTAETGRKISQLSEEERTTVATCKIPTVEFTGGNPDDTKNYRVKLADSCEGHAIEYLRRLHGMSKTVNEYSGLEVMLRDMGVKVKMPPEVLEAEEAEKDAMRRLQAEEDRKRSLEEAETSEEDDEGQEEDEEPEGEEESDEEGQEADDQTEEDTEESEPEAEKEEEEEEDFLSDNAPATETVKAVQRAASSRRASSGNKSTGASRGQRRAKNPEGWAAMFTDTQKDYIREWARGKKIKVSDRGRIANAVYETFDAAGRPGLPKA